MKPKRAFSLFLMLLALIVGGCTTQSPRSQAAGVEFTLQTVMRDGKMIFIGVGGTFTYYCTVAGHRQMGMEGKLFVTQ